MTTRPCAPQHQYSMGLGNPNPVAVKRMLSVKTEDHCGCWGRAVQVRGTPPGTGALVAMEVGAVRGSIPLS